MLGKLLILLLLIGTFYWVKIWFRSLEKGKQKDAIWTIALWSFVAIMAVAVLTGKMHWLGLAFAALLTGFKFFVVSAIRYAPFLKMFAKHTPFSTPGFSTKYLKLRMNMGTMTLEGEVLEGPHAGKAVQSLNKEELVELAAFYREKCKRSYYLIMAILQKNGGQAEGGKPNTYVDAGELSVAEAQEILGLNAGFTRDEVIASHRRLIQKLHPDKGGSDYLASRVNLAKKILLDSSA